MRNSFVIALLAAALAACGTNKGSGSPPGAIDESGNLIGIWRMSPLGAEPESGRARPSKSAGLTAERESLLGAPIQPGSPVKPASEPMTH